MATRAFANLPNVPDVASQRAIAWSKGARDQAVHPADELPASLLHELEELVRQATSTAEAAKALATAHVLVGSQPVHFSVRYSLLLLREKAGETDGLRQEVESLFHDQPDDRQVLEMYLRALLKADAKDSALAILEPILPAACSSPHLLAQRADLLDRLKLHTESDAAYASALALDDQLSIRIEWAKRLAKRFLFEDAGQLLDRLPKPPSGEKAIYLKASIDSERAFFGRFWSQEDLLGKDFRLVAMELAVLRYRNRKIPDPPLHALKLVFVTGSLGAGGAERQLCSLARLVKTSIANKSDEVSFSDIEVVVKEHARRGVSDFFLPDLEDLGIPVRQINEMKPVKAQQQAVMDPDLAYLFGKLPPQVHYGVTRLAPHFRAAQPDVVSLWQDGACLFGALAALFAGVPRIQLMFRGLPPSIRINRYKPEYQGLYHALSMVPGVEFVCNSLSGARAYADWLGMPLKRFKVFYNGVDAANDVPTDADLRSWERFEAATADATETIGGVFRFESDKRPLAWLKIAAAYARERPKARFVLVGDGRLLDMSREKAEQLRIADRLLFVGTSRAVGFWYDRMDVKLLTSRFEGLPNVLIEAQLRGCPVVSTPAGGAAECFANGLTGHLLDCASNPDPDLASECIRALVDLRRCDPDGMRDQTQTFAQRFGVDVFFARFRDICSLPLTARKDD
jgi:glycosyltransferase involved in cell wall biosynthesis